MQKSHVQPFWLFFLHGGWAEGALTKPDHADGGEELKTDAEADETGEKGFDQCFDFRLHVDEVDVGFCAADAGVYGH